ncbi:hypothetical protein BASA61_007778 [Batrachochytrium salamandrivorans]|nr:hypothetical protein BASA61_007778 [Batrachochytrium salamandrivorans]
MSFSQANRALLPPSYRPPPPPPPSSSCSLKDSTIATSNNVLGKSSTAPSSLGHQPQNQSQWIQTQYQQNQYQAGYQQQQQQLNQGYYFLNNDLQSHHQQQQNPSSGIQQSQDWASYYAAMAMYTQQQQQQQQQQQMMMMYQGTQGYAGVVQYPQYLPQTHLQVRGGEQSSHTHKRHTRSGRRRTADHQRQNGTLPDLKTPDGSVDNSVVPIHTSVLETKCISNGSNSHSASVAISHEQYQSQDVDPKSVLSTETSFLVHGDSLNSNGAGSTLGVSTDTFIERDEDTDGSSLEKDDITDSTSLIVTKVHLDNPEDIERWIQERKRRFPTDANIKHKLEESEKRKKRGDVIDIDKKRFKGQGTLGKQRKDRSSQQINICTGDKQPTNCITVPKLSNSAGNIDTVGADCSKEDAIPDIDADNQAVLLNTSLIDKSGQSIPRNTRICKYFKRGNCNNGDKCHHRHEAPLLRESRSKQLIKAEPRLNPTAAPIKGTNRRPLLNMVRLISAAIFFFFPL